MAFTEILCLFYIMGAEENLPPCHTSAENTIIISFLIDLREIAQALFQLCP